MCPIIAENWLDTTPFPWYCGGVFEIAEWSIYAILFTILYFEVFLLITALEKAGKREPEGHSKWARFPSVSVIIPCWNEERTIAKTIRSLLALNYPKNKLDIVVVDDGSTDKSAEIIERFNRHSNVKIFHQENSGKHAAVNLGIENTDSELVGCLDADCTVDPDSLKHLAARFENPDVMAVTPAIKVRDPKTILEHMQRAEYILGIFFRKTFATLNSQFITPGPFSIYRRGVFEKVGLFRKAYNTEDLEIGLRMQKAGMFIDNEPKAVVHTSVPATFPKLVKQRTRWAYGFLNNAVIHRSLFFSFGHVSLGFVILPTVFASILGGLYVAVSVLGYILNFLFDTALYTYAIKAVPFSLSLPSFDLFYMPTEAPLFIAAALIAITFILFIFGSDIAKEKRIISKDIVFYFALYGILAPVWLSKAALETALMRGNSWR